MSRKTITLELTTDEFFAVQDSLEQTIHGLGPRANADATRRDRIDQLDRMKDRLRHAWWDA